MKEGKTINGIIYMINTVVTEIDSEGVKKIFKFATEQAAKTYFNQRRIIKKGRPRLHRREVATVYYKQTIICL